MDQLMQTHRLFVNYGCYHSAGRVGECKENDVNEGQANLVGGSQG